MHKVSLSDKCRLCIKSFLVVFNFIFMLVSIGIVVLVVWCNWFENNRDGQHITYHKTDSLAKYLPYILYGAIGYGICCLLVSLLGCCGTLTDNRCMLDVYGATLLLILIGELVVVVLAIVLKCDAGRNIADVFLENKYHCFQNMLKAQNETVLDVTGNVTTDLKAEKTIQEYSPIFLVLVGVLIFLQMFGVIFTCILRCRKDEATVQTTKFVKTYKDEYYF